VILVDGEMLVELVIGYRARRASGQVR